MWPCLTWALDRRSPCCSSSRWFSSPSSSSRASGRTSRRCGVIGDGEAQRSLVDPLGGPDPHLGTVPVALDDLSVLQGPEHLPQRVAYLLPDAVGGDPL